MEIILVPPLANTKLGRSDICTDGTRTRTSGTQGGRRACSGSGRGLRRVEYGAPRMCRVVWLDYVHGLERLGRDR